MFDSLPSGPTRPCVADKEHTIVSFAALCQGVILPKASGPTIWQACKPRALVISTDLLQSRQAAERVWPPTVKGLCYCHAFLSSFCLQTAMPSCSCLFGLNTDAACALHRRSKQEQLRAGDKLHRSDAPLLPVRSNSARLCVMLLLPENGLDMSLAEVLMIAASMWGSDVHRGAKVSGTCEAERYTSASCSHTSAS